MQPSEQIKLIKEQALTAFLAGRLVDAYLIRDALSSKGFDAVLRDQRLIARTTQATTTKQPFNFAVIDGQVKILNPRQKQSLLNSIETPPGL